MTSLPDATPLNQKLYNIEKISLEELHYSPVTGVLILSAVYTANQHSLLCKLDYKSSIRPMQLVESALRRCKILDFCCNF